MALFAMRRGIEVTYGILYQMNYDKKTKPEKIPVTSRTSRTVDSSTDTSDSNKKSSEENKEQTLVTLPKAEYAILKPENDTLLMKYGIKFPGTFKIEIQEDKIYKNLVKNFNTIIRSTNSKVQKAKKIYVEALAQKIVSGVTGWRNRDMADEIITEVEIIENDIKETVQFNNVQFLGIETIDKNTLEVLKPFEEENFEKLTNFIYEALFNRKNNSFYTLKIKHYFKFNTGGINIYPSQLFNDSKNNSEKGRKLFSIDGTAAITSEKISNALRKFDVFASDKVIAFYEYGQDLSFNTLYRPYHVYNKTLPAGVEDKIYNRAFYFYKELFLPEIEDMETSIEQLKVEEYIYFFAILLKGGVWGTKDVDNKLGKMKVKVANIESINVEVSNKTKKTKKK